MSCTATARKPQANDSAFPSIAAAVEVGQYLSQPYVQGRESADDVQEALATLRELAAEDPGVDDRLSAAEDELEAAEAKITGLTDAVFEVCNSEHPDLARTALIDLFQLVNAGDADDADRFIALFTSTTH